MDPLDPRRQDVRGKGGMGCKGGVATTNPEDTLDHKMLGKEMTNKDKPTRQSTRLKAPGTPRKRQLKSLL